MENLSAEIREYIAATTLIDCTDMKLYNMKKCM